MQYDMPFYDATNYERNYVICDITMMIKFYLDTSNIFFSTYCISGRSKKETWCQC